MKNPEIYSINDIELPVDITFEKLISILEIAKIPYHEWGIGDARTVNDFLNEIKSGESVVTLSSDQKLQRQIDVALIEVVHVTKDYKVYGLCEDRQVFNDGRVKKRKLPASISIKIMPDEAPEEAGVRALKEELGIDELTEISEFNSRRETIPSTSYPGVTTYCNSYPFFTPIDSNSFNPDGYIKTQDDKTTYYVWEIVKD